MNTLINFPSLVNHVLFGFALLSAIATILYAGAAAAAEIGKTVNPTQSIRKDLTALAKFAALCVTSLIAMEGMLTFVVKFLNPDISVDSLAAGHLLLYWTAVLVPTIAFARAPARPLSQGFADTVQVEI